MSSKPRNKIKRASNKPTRDTNLSIGEALEELQKGRGWFETAFDEERLQAAEAYALRLSTNGEVEDKDGKLPSELYIKRLQQIAEIEKHYRGIVKSSISLLDAMIEDMNGGELVYNYMNGKCSKILPNPNGDKAAIRALVKALSSSTMILSGQELNKAMLTQALRDAKKALEHPDVKPILSDLKQEDLLNG